MLPKFQQHTDGLDMILPEERHRQMVPLHAVAKLVPRAWPQSIRTSGQLPSVTISLRCVREPLWARLQTIIEAAARARLPRYQSRGTFQGTAKVSRIPMQNMGILLIVADCGGLHVLWVCCYESYVHTVDDSVGYPAVGRFGRVAHPADLQR
jgi:multidrug efflux pump subunit AcrB